MKVSQTWIQHPQWWFNSTPKTDREVITFYGTNFLNIHCQDDLDYLILYDQLARHYFRNDPLNYSIYTVKALEYTNRLLIGNKGRFSPEEFVFILLPLRHTKVPSNIQRALSELRIHPLYSLSPSIFVRFYKASIQQLSKFHEIGTKVYLPCQRTFKQWSSTDILEFSPTSHLKLLEKALEEDINFINKWKPNQIVVSLSGGVDSMVLLHRFSKVCQELGKECCAIHINYGNRGEICQKEVELLRDFCEELNIKLYVREIYEIQRTKDKEREFYEELTRQIRFDMYKIVSGSNGMVLLGHHQDDAVENILSNIRKERNWGDLRGMNTTHIERAVWVGRPLLNSNKKVIIEYAHNYNIPYLEDSTPKWSERGRMRDIVIPALNTFDNQCHGLVKMSEEMKHLYHLMEESVWKPFRKNIVRLNEDDVKMELTNASLQWGNAFWNETMIDIARTLKVIYPSHKSIQNFLKMCEKSRNIKCIFNQSMEAYIYDNHVIFHRRV